MKVYRYLAFIAISSSFWLSSCNEEQNKNTETQAPPVVVTNNDIEQAKEIFLSDPVIDSTWLIDSSNTGFGQRQDFNADSAAVKHLYAQEENTDWYKFTGSADTSLSITVEPNDPSAEYDMVVFKGTGDSTGPDLRKGLIPAIRSNFAKISKPEDTITGLQCDPRLADFVPSDSIHQFSRAFWMQKGETYYLVLNTTTPKGKGYKLRFHSCAPGGYGKPIPPAPPVISAFKPGSGTEGKQITIMGEHFTGATVVTLGGTEVSSFEVVSDNEIKATIAGGATGTVLVSTPNGSAEKEGFRYYSKSSGGKKAKVKPRKKSVDDGGDYYIVKPKDTMFSIAFIFGMTVDEVLKLNNLTNTNVFVGQKLKVIRRQLPQKVIEQKHTTAPVVKPSPPEKGSTTDPEQIAQRPVEPVKPIETPADNKPKDWNLTKNFPQNTPSKTNLEEKGILEPADKSFFLYCNVTSGVNKQAVGGTLQVVDLKNKDLVYNVQANKTAKVPLFNKGGRSKLIICDIFGYKKQDFDINLDNLINDTTENYVQIQDDTIVVNFELKRLEKGDVAVAYNIFYYDDASVMLPKSTYELDQLLEMLNENPKYKVKIHGHTNTSKLGKILYLEKGDPNFFRLTARNKETFGPAKMLSKKRAETIKYYLQSKKIADDRLETEGHGGSDMLYPATHPLAFKNKRVEIEILEDK
jgi:outer membrane protein OmpA-like peptidoglycan-associated protein/LysM repeat protein